MKAYGWPGNVRELRNVVERAMLLADGPTLTLGDFPVAATPAKLTEQVDLPAAGIDLEHLERSLVVHIESFPAGPGNIPHSSPLSVAEFSA